MRTGPTSLYVVESQKVISTAVPILHLIHRHVAVARVRQRSVTAAEVELLVVG